jgi:hypothetical protein
VFGTIAAREWLRLLEAIERPTSSLRAHAAALTSFLGWSAEHVATASESEWETIHGRLHQWAAVLRVRGVASLMETVDRMENLPARVLAETDGERHLTDLRHIGQLLHGAAVSERMGVAALVGWLERRIEEASTDTGDEDGPAAACSRQGRMRAGSCAWAQAFAIASSRSIQLKLASGFRARQKREVACSDSGGAEHPGGGLDGGLSELCQAPGRRGVIGVGLADRFGGAKPSRRNGHQQRQ